jgi:segregation and condensation protein B
MTPDDTDLPPVSADPQVWVAAIEAVLLAADQPLSLDVLQRLLADPDAPTKAELRAALAALDASLSGRAVELVEVASGWRLQIRQQFTHIVNRLWEEKPARLSRALLETLAIICYQQPVTRGDIEEIRGVGLSAGIMRTLLERGWIREVGIKEVPGRPTLFGTTAQLLDDLGLRSLEQLPELPAIKDPEQLEAALLALNAEGPLLSHSPADVRDPSQGVSAEVTRH